MKKIIILGNLKFKIQKVIVIKDYYKKNMQEYNNYNKN